MDDELILEHFRRQREKEQKRKRRQARRLRARLQPPLSGKGDNRLAKRLHGRGHSLHPLGKNAQGVPRWKELDINKRLRVILHMLKYRGAKRLHLDLSQEVQEELRQHGLEPLRQRLRTALGRAIGRVPAFAIAIDSKRGRLHVHGAIEVTHNTEALVKRALRQAGGRWNGPVGNRRQLVLNELTKPHLCARYMLKAHGALGGIPGVLVTWTNDVRREAEREYEWSAW